MVTAFKIYLVYVLLLFGWWLYGRVWAQAHKIEVLEIQLGTRKTPIWLWLLMLGIILAVAAGIALGILFIITCL